MILDCRAWLNGLVARGIVCFCRRVLLSRLSASGKKKVKGRKNGKSNMERLALGIDARNIKIQGGTEVPWKPGKKV